MSFEVSQNMVEVFTHFQFSHVNIRDCRRKNMWFSFQNPHCLMILNCNFSSTLICVKCLGIQFEIQLIFYLVALNRPLRHWIEIEFVQIIGTLGPTHDLKDRFHNILNLKRMEDITGGHLRNKIIGRPLEAISCLTQLIQYSEAYSRRQTQKNCTH